MSVSEVIPVRVTERAARRIRAAAQLRGVSVSQLGREALERAAGDALAQEAGVKELAGAASE